MHPTDRAYEHLIEAFRPEVIPGYKRLTRAVHEYDTRIFAQLNHNGQQCSGSLSRLPVWAPSAVPDVLYRETPKVMEIEDIKEVQAYFAKSAVHVREGGFDGVELQFGHSSLVRQFMSPLTNYRGDEYGGEFENRLRFALETIAAVREAVGADFTLGVRLCADEMIPGRTDPGRRQADRPAAADHGAPGLLQPHPGHLLQPVPGGRAHAHAPGIRGAAGGRHQGSGDAARLRHRAHQRPGPGRAGAGRGAGRHDRRGTRPDRRPGLGRQGPRSPHRGDPLLHRLQPELLRTGGAQQDHRLRPEPVRRSRSHRRRAPSEARAPQEAGDGCGRGSGRHVGGQDRHPARPRRDPLREGPGAGRTGAAGGQGRGPGRVRRDRSK